MPASMTPLLVSDDGLFPDITSNGDSFFTAWMDGNGLLHARTLTVERELGRVRSLGVGQAPRITWDGFAYIVAFAREVSAAARLLVSRAVRHADQRLRRRRRNVGEVGVILPRTWDVDARDGRVHLVVSSNEVTLRSATVREPRPRIRVLRH